MLPPGFTTFPLVHPLAALAHTAAPPGSHPLGSRTRPGNRIVPVSRSPMRNREGRSTVTSIEAIATAVIRMTTVVAAAASSTLANG